MKAAINLGSYCVPALRSHRTTLKRDKMAGIIAENQELIWIIAASIKTARGGSDSPI